MWPQCVLPLILLVAESVSFLIYPESYSSNTPSRIQVIFGAGFPVDLEVENVVIGSVVKGNYYLPYNATQFTDPMVTYARNARDVPTSRWAVYSRLSQVAEDLGFGGKACILHTICELAQQPLDDNYDLLEELMHAVFTPSATTEEVIDHSDNEYLAAEEIGRTSKGNCRASFPDCNLSIVDLFTNKLWE